MASLNTGTSTIRAAMDIQKASVVAAATPMAYRLHLKNTGADLATFKKYKDYSPHLRMLGRIDQRPI
jgi:hypothetical protein